MPSYLTRLRALLFDNPGLAFLLLSRFGTTLSFQILSVAVGWQIYDITHDPVYLGYVGLAQFLPMMALTLVAGDLADRMDRRIILVAASLVEAIVAGLFLLLTLSGIPAIWPFYLLLALFGAARAFLSPTQQALLPMLVRREQLGQAVAIGSSTFQVAIIIGPALGGMIYALGPTVTYSLCFALFLVVTVAFSLIGERKTKRREDVSSARMIERVKQGIAFVRGQPIVLGAISLDLFAVLLGGATALLPAFARDILHTGPAGLGFLRSSTAVGATLTALALSVWPLTRHTGKAMFACVAVFGLATIVFGLSTHILLSCAALAVLGASDMISVYVRSTLVQIATPDAMRGRVSAVNMLFIGASNELGEFESGITAGWWGSVPAVVIGGLGTLAVVGLWMWRFPALRRVDRMTDVNPD